MIIGTVIKDIFPAVERTHYNVKIDCRNFLFLCDKNDTRTYENIPQFLLTLKMIT